jgi:hypothetical protein
MLIVLLVFFGVFFCRDVQVLAMQGPAFGSRFSIYALLQIAAIALMTELRMTRFAWTGLAIQLAELAVAIALRRCASGRHSWIGWMLPSPIFLLTLYGLSLVIRDNLIPEPYQALALATSAWLVLVGGAGWLFNRTTCTPEDRKFISDAALITSCTALVFIPVGLV